MNHPTGTAMVEVSEEELTRVYGDGDVQPKTSPLCVAGGIIIGVKISKAIC